MASALKESRGKEQNGVRTESSRAVQPASTDESRELAPYRRGGLMSAFEPFDRLFEQFFRGWPTPFIPAMNRQWNWGTEVHEDENEVVVRAEVPGFAPEDFDITVSGDHLHMCACHQTEDEAKDKTSHEWSRQEFSRIVPLPAGTDADKIEAHYRNGVLVVKLPKSAEAKGRKIVVQS